MILSNFQDQTTSHLQFKFEQFAIIHYKSSKSIKYSNNTLKFMKLGQSASNVVHFRGKMRRPNVTTYFRHFLHKNNHFWHLNNGNNIFINKKNLFLVATLFTVVTPMVVPNMSMLAAQIQWKWPRPHAYALKSMQLHTIQPIL